MARAEADKLDDELEIREDDEFLTLDEACAFMGGEKKPIHVATFYRNVKRGIYPPLVHPSPGITRAVKRHLARARARIAGMR